MRFLEAHEVLQTEREVASEDALWLSPRTNMQGVADLINEEPWIFHSKNEGCIEGEVALVIFESGGLQRHDGLIQGFEALKMWFGLLGRMKDRGLRYCKQESEHQIRVVFLLLCLFDSQVFNICAEIYQFKHHPCILDVFILLILFLNGLKHSGNFAFAYDSLTSLINMHYLLLHLETDIYHIFNSLALFRRV